MLIPLEQWICDRCGEIIESPSDGYTIWRSNDEGRPFDFKIIHQSRCDDRTYSCSMDIESHLGANGLTRLTSYLSPGPVQRNLGREDFKTPVDLDEFIDFFRRLQLPHYEEARTKFASHELLDDLSDANEVYPYQVQVLKDLITRDYDA